MKAKNNVNKGYDVKTKRKMNSVMQILGMNSDRLWYPIGNGLNGYEVSNDGYVRSLKLYKNRGGCLIHPDDKGFFNLTDSEGNKVSIRLEELKDMASNNEFCTPRRTEEIETGGRNNRAFQVKFDDDYFYQPVKVHFTVAPDVEDAKPTNSQSREIICPIYSLRSEDIKNGY